MTLAQDLDLEEYITAKDDLSGADIKVYIKRPTYESQSLLCYFTHAWEMRVFSDCRQSVLRLV